MTPLGPGVRRVRYPDPSSFVAGFCPLGGVARGTIGGHCYPSYLSTGGTRPDTVRNRHVGYDSIGRGRNGFRARYLEASGEAVGWRIARLVDWDWGLVVEGMGTCTRGVDRA